MISSAQIQHLSRTAYHLCKALTNTALQYNSDNSGTKKPLINNMVPLYLDHTKGTPQHKDKVLRLLANPKLDNVEVVDEFKVQTQIDNCSAVATLTDVRSFKELPVIEQYHKHNSKQIAWIQSNGDSVAGDFHAQKQNHQDFWTYLYSAYNNATTCRPFSVVVRPGDEKAGRDMLDSATRGHLGLLTYDKDTQENIQIMSQSYSKYDLIEAQKHNLKMIAQGIAHDIKQNPTYEIYPFEKEIWQAHEILHDKGIPSYLINEKYQTYIFNNIHCDPRYNRSLSFIYTIDVAYHDTEDKLHAFHSEFIKEMGHKQIYNLDKRGDQIHTAKAMINAYRKTVDPRFLEQLKYLHFNEDMQIPKYTLDIISALIKTTI